MYRFFCVPVFTATEYVLFLPVGLLFIKKNLLICIWTQISIFPRAPSRSRDRICDFFILFNFYLFDKCTRDDIRKYFKSFQ